MFKSKAHTGTADVRSCRFVTVFRTKIHTYRFANQIHKNLKIGASFALETMLSLRHDLFYSRRSERNYQNRFHFKAHQTEAESSAGQFSQSIEFASHHEW